MKKIVLIALIGAGLLAMNGCEKKSPVENASVKQTAKETTSAVKKDAQNMMKCQAGKCGQGKCGGK